MTSGESRTLVFAGGGTGGHLFPGIAVATEWLERDRSHRVAFIGSEKPLERDILSRAGFEHHALSSCSPSLHPARCLSSLLGNMRAYRHARRLLKELAPRAVIGLGGFASVPPVLAAWRAGLPIVLLEQNAVPGRATRWLSRLTDLVCLPFENMASGLPGSVKTLVTGNPPRREIADLMLEPNRSHDQSPTLLILGGSQGAVSLNRFVKQAIRRLVDPLTEWHIVHQSGAADVDSLREFYRSLNLNADVVPFIPDMAKQYRRSTIVISRAGATTLAELACAGRPAILIPLPTSAHDHQRVNAELFAKQHAATLVTQAENTEAVQVLADQLTSLISDSALRNSMSLAMRSLARPRAALDVIEAVERILAAKSERPTSGGR